MSATSSNGSGDGGGGAAVAVKKQPMSPSEFFAKIYGDASASTEHKSTEETSLQERLPQQETKEPSWLYHPHWAAAAAASAASHPGLIDWSRPFYNPLQLPPALTALSKIIFKKKIVIQSSIYYYVRLLLSICPPPPTCSETRSQKRGCIFISISVIEPCCAADGSRHICHIDSHKQSNSKSCVMSQQRKWERGGDCFALIRADHQVIICVFRDHLLTSSLPHHCSVARPSISDILTKGKKEKDERERGRGRCTLDANRI